MIRKLTDPKIGMIVYLRGLFSEFENATRCRITYIHQHYYTDNSVSIWVIDADTYSDIGWCPLACLFVEDNKHNWLHEGF